MLCCNCKYVCTCTIEKDKHLSIQHPEFHFHCMWARSTHGVWNSTFHFHTGTLCGTPCVKHPTSRMEWHGIEIEQNVWSSNSSSTCKKWSCKFHGMSAFLSFYAAKMNIYVRTTVMTWFFCKASLNQSDAS